MPGRRNGIIKERISSTRAINTLRVEMTTTDGC